jgi:serine/threonine protein kinase
VLHTADPPVMHRDVKGSNVFLDKDRHVLLADFDLATEEPTANDSCGTPGYMVRPSERFICRRLQ